MREVIGMITIREILELARQPLRDKLAEAKEREAQAMRRMANGDMTAMEDHEWATNDIREIDAKLADIDALDGRPRRNQRREKGMT